METFECSFLTQNENEQAYQTTILWFMNVNFLSSGHIFRERGKKSMPLEDAATPYSQQ